VLFWDVESKVKWCVAINILNNRNLKGKMRFHIPGYYRDSFCGCLKKCKHNFLIVDATFLSLVKAIIHKIVQRGFTARENIHAQLNTTNGIHILNFDFHVGHYLVLDQPI